MAILLFPANPDEGDIHNPPGSITYMYKNRAWTSVAPGYTIPTGDFVEVIGDKMTGSLESPRFIGNFGLDELDDLS